MSVPTAISEMSTQIISLKDRIDLRESSRISGHRDYSRLSCDAGDTQLGPKTKISARILRGRWSTGRYLFQLAPYSMRPSQQVCGLFERWTQEGWEAAWAAMAKKDEQNF